jgi:hypothetical protein
MLGRFRYHQTGARMDFWIAVSQILVARCGAVSADVAARRVSLGFGFTARVPY